MAIRGVNLDCSLFDSKRRLINYLICLSLVHMHVFAGDHSECTSELTSREPVGRGEF